MSDCISMWSIPPWREEGCLHQTLPYIRAHTLVAEAPQTGPTLEPVVILVAHLVPRIS